MQYSTVQYSAVQCNAIQCSQNFKFCATSHLNTPSTSELRMSSLILSKGSAPLKRNIKQCGMLYPPLT